MGNERVWYSRCLGKCVGVESRCGPLKCEGFEEVITPFSGFWTVFGKSGLLLRKSKGCEGRDDLVSGISGSSWETGL